jgi:hypothetical protein
MRGGWRDTALSWSKDDKIFSTTFFDGNTFLRKFVVSDRSTRKRIILG